MKRTTQKQVLKKVVLSVHCDAPGCRNHENDPDPPGWAHFSSHHSDWGNDSIESWDEHDVCSPACYFALLARIVDDYTPKGTGFTATLEADGKDYEFLTAMLAAPKTPANTGPDA